MDREIKVSIIIPIYNVEKYVERAVESVLNQSIKEIEVILINDGSTDKSGELIKKYEVDHRVTIINKKNEGQGKARNIGIEISKGNYVGFVDADDWIDERFYESMIDKVKKENAQMAIAGRKIIDVNNKLKMTVNQLEVVGNFKCYDDKKNYISNKFFYPYSAIVCNKLYSSKIIKEKNIRFKDVSEVGSEDTLFNYEFINNIDKYITVDGIYYNSFQRSDSTMRTYRAGYMERTNKLIKSLYDIEGEINSNILSIFIYFYDRNIEILSNFNIKNIYKTMREEFNFKNDSCLRVCVKKIAFTKIGKEVLLGRGFKLKGIIFSRLKIICIYLRLYKILTTLELRWGGLKK